MTNQPTFPIYCLHDGQTHDFTVADLEQLVHVLQAVEHDTAVDAKHEAPNRTPDTYDCLQDLLGLASDSEAYLEHVTQQLLRRRDLAGPRPGDTDLCRRCSELIEFSSLQPGTLPAWRHSEPLDMRGLVAHLPEPDPERQP